MNDQDKLLQTVAITDVINRYFAAADQKQFDEATLGQIFTDDAKVTRPNGTSLTGPKEIGESHARSFSRFRATQHLPSGLIVTFTDSPTAEFRVNVLAMHLWAEGMGDPNAAPIDNYFLAGTVITGQVVLVADGWRITELTNEPTWRQGTGFQQILETK